ncbi:MAG: hypothetical protein RR998_00080 [Oscillospiraceae bacterium]
MLVNRVNRCGNEDKRVFIAASALYIAERRPQRGILCREFIDPLSIMAPLSRPTFQKLS